MNHDELNKIKQDVKAAAEQLLTEAKYTRANDIFVLGASTSEVAGQKLGTASSLEIGQAIVSALLEVTKAHQLILAIQGCEHINRALIIERDALDLYDLEEVNVVPQLHAGGACSVAAWEQFEDPTAVEFIAATVGMDIGDTEIGMHIKHVQRPVRLSVTHIGQAHLTSLMYRPKLIGGDRSVHRG